MAADRPTERHSRLREFLRPRWSRRYCLRLSVAAALALIVFGGFFRPFFLNGGSMLPAYPERGLVLVDCVRPRFVPLRRGAVTVIAYFGRRYLLKRVVALPGETVECRRGTVFIDGEALPEPYVRRRGNWDFPAVKVKSGHVFVIGDNRSMPMPEHLFGEVAADRIVGVPWW